MSHDRIPLSQFLLQEWKIALEMIDYHQDIVMRDIGVDLLANSVHDILV